jgi:hypothetical protein
MLTTVRSPLAGIGGKIDDLGDLIRVEALIIKGKRPYFVFRIGAPRKVKPADRGHPVPPAQPRFEGADVQMDLKADQQVTLSADWRDEVGNPADAPDGATLAYTVDNTDVIALTDNGDGTAVAAATGSLGTATVHAEVTAGGRTISGDLLIAVVPGDAERFEIAASEPTEVSPDETP